MKVCFASRAQRVMVKATQKSDLPWSAIFSVIVYFALMANLFLFWEMHFSKENEKIHLSGPIYAYLKANLLRGKAKKIHARYPFLGGWYLPATRAVCFIFAGGVLASGRW